MLDVARDRLGYRRRLTILQGSYHKTTTASAGTHDGGGAVDLTPYQADRKQHALRAVGFAAWHRYPIPGVWPEHVHAIAIGDKQLSPAAAAQVHDYYHHLNGLADHAPDPTWHPHPIPIFDFTKWKRADTLLDSDKQWLERHFTTLNKHLSAFRHDTHDRDQAIAHQLQHIVDLLGEDATKEQVHKVRRLVADVKHLLESSSTT
jgi:hypothetical protein